MFGNLNVVSFPENTGATNEKMTNFLKNYSILAYCFLKKFTNIIEVILDVIYLNTSYELLAFYCRKHNFYFVYQQERTPKYFER